MRRLFTFVIAIVISAISFAQKFPFGTYYFMPKTGDNSSRDFKVREIKISPRKIDEKYTDAKLNPLNGPDAMASGNKIDTIVPRNDLFYFVFKQKEKYGYGLLQEREGYVYSVLRKAVKGKYPVLELRANNYTHLYETKQAAIEAIDKDSLPFFPITYFPKAALQKFATLKPVDSIDHKSYKSILQKIADTRRKERQYYKTIPVADVQHYAISRFFGMSYLYFFVEAGFSPFINGDDMENLYKKYKSDHEIRNLYDDAW